MCPAIDSGIATSDTLVSYGLIWPNTMANVFLLNTVIDVFAKLNSPQFPRLSFFTVVV